MRNHTSLTLALATILAAFPLVATAQPAAEDIDLSFPTAEEVSIDAPEGDTTSDVPMAPVSGPEETTYRGAVHTRTLRRYGLNIQVIGRTYWPGVRHYSRAAIIRRGRLIQDTGRRWGYSRTVAATGFVNLRRGPVLIWSGYGR